MMTRGQVARHLGKSIATVRRMEGTLLHPRRDATGVLRFDPDEVRRVTSHMRRQASRSPSSAARSGWFRASVDDENDDDADDPEEREHQARLRRQDEERRADDERRARQHQEHAEEQRRKAEQRRFAEEEARLGALRREVADIATDVAAELERCSRRDLKHLSRDAAFLDSLDELFRRR